MLILGVESSCDETGLSLVEDGRNIITDSREFQDELHAPYGGVVPEFAARHHAEKIWALFEKTLQKGGITADEIDGIGVTNGPGLIGSLLVGFMFAKGLSSALKRPLIPVNHILAHLYLPLMVFPNEIEYPHYAVLLSGGHTFIIRASSVLEFEILAKTRDDAIGEAFDKIAFSLGLGYPGGKKIDDRSSGQTGGFEFPVTRFKEKTLDFSYSGLKTATLEKIRKGIPSNNLPGFLYDFQRAAFDIVFRSLVKLMKDSPLPQIVFGGGVASNSFLRDYAPNKLSQFDCRTYFPPPAFCTDNGAMVGGLAYHLLKAGLTDRGDDVFSRSDFRKTY